MVPLQCDNFYCFLSVYVFRSCAVLVIPSVQGRVTLAIKSGLYVRLNVVSDITLSYIQCRKALRPFYDNAVQQVVRKTFS